MLPKSASHESSGGEDDYASEPSTLVAREVSKTYVTDKGVNRDALQPVSLTIREGEFRSLVGPSGCGKTTLMKIIGGLLNATTGHLTFRNRAGGPTPRELGIVFQSPALLPWRSVIDNVLLPAQLLKLPKAGLTSRARSLLELVHLDGLERALPGELSGGMQQRAALARALLHDPAVLLMDEPFGALDAMTRDQLNDELQSLHVKSQKTVVFVTHSITEAVFLSDYVTVFSQSPGRILETIEIPFARPRSHAVEGSSEFQHIAQHLRDLLSSPGAPRRE